MNQTQTQTRTDHPALEVTAAGWLDSPPGARVTESMLRQQPQPWLLRTLQRANGVPDRAAHLHAAMTTTLARLAAAVEPCAPDA